MKIYIYGKEHTFLEPDSGLLYRNSSLKETAPPHTHTFYEVFVVTSGTALHMINQTIQTLKEGDFVFIRPQDVHSYEFHHSSDFRIINVGFSTQLYESMKDFLSYHKSFYTLENSALPPVLSLNPDQLAYVINHLKEIGENMESANTLYTITNAKAILSRLFLNFLFQEEGAEDMPEQSPKWFQEMLIEMDQLDNLQIGFPKMLELSACSSNHLCRTFKKITNQTPTEYINQKRLNYAVYYLTQTADEIIQISEVCGFNNLSHFYHLFKKRYDCSPGKFRRNHPIV